MAKKHERPFQYLSSNIRKEDTARQLAERDNIEAGLVCIFSIVEPAVQSARRKCLHLYFYFMDRDFGLIHVRIQTWFPMQIQVYLNGHEWLARKLSANHVRYTKHDNVFLRIENMAKAQTFADRFVSLNWPLILEKYAKRVNPQRQDILHDPPLLLGDGSKRILDRHSIQASSGPLRTVPTTTQPQHIVLWRQGSRELMAGEHCLRGFTNRNIRARLAPTGHLRTCGHDPIKESAKVSRTFRRFHAHALIAKIPRTRRWRVTLYGRRVMGTSLYLRDHDFPKAYSKIAA